MSKVPQPQHPQRPPGLFGWRQRRKQSPALMVAEPLTEEEAAVELEAKRKEEEDARRAEEEKRSAKRKKKRPAPPAEDEVDECAAPALVRVAVGRFGVSLNTVGCIVASSAICVTLLGAYAIGRRSADDPASGGLSPVAGVTTPRTVAESPLFSSGPGRAAFEEKGRRETAASPDLSALLDGPASRHDGAVRANEPASVEFGGSEPAVGHERLNYLQIESFAMTRDRDRGQILQDVADVQAFLRARGVETVARQLGSSYAVFGQRGFSPGGESEAQRNAFRQKIEQYGREYRQSGGLYGFKGCLFVSHARSRAGRPVGSS
jgi:hypothetical protein